MTSKKGQEPMKEKEKVEEKSVEEIAAKIREKELIQRKEDIDHYLKDGIVFESIRGKKVKVPPLSGKGEKRALSALIAFIVGDPDILKLFSGGKFSFDSEVALKLLTDSTGEQAFDCLQKMTAALMGASVEWVDKNLLLAEMVKVVRPFFVIEGDLLVEMRDRRKAAVLTDGLPSEK